MDGDLMPPSEVVALSGAWAGLVQAADELGKAIQEARAHGNDWDLIAEWANMTVEQAQRLADAKSDRDLERAIGLGR